jgi:SAM-dependent methyltransferase
MIDDAPKAFLVLLATALAVGRFWLAVDGSSPLALSLRRGWTPHGRRLAIVAVAITAFVVVAEDVVFEEHDEVILRVDRAIQASVTGLTPAGALAVVVSYLTAGSAALLGACSVVFLLAGGRRADAVRVLVGTLTAWGLAGLLKAVCGVLRHGAGSAWPTGGGFPSEHPLIAVVTLGTVVWVVGRDQTRVSQLSLWVVAGTIVLAGGVAQVIMGTHWPSDVVGGLTAGTAWLAIVTARVPGRGRRGSTGRDQQYLKPEEIGRLDRAVLRGPRRRPDRPPPAVRYQAADVAETYDRRRFCRLSGRYNNWRLRRLLRRCLRNLPPHSIVLDVPCGTGRIDNWLLEKLLRVVAADISNEMLAVARRRIGRTSSWLGFVRADAERLPFRTGSVDAVVSIRFLHLLDRDARLTVLREAARVARQWVLIEYRGLDKRIKMAKRALVRRLTGREVGRNRIIPGIIDELNECGLRVQSYFLISRWFSGSVLILARCVGPTVPEAAIQAPLFRSAE